MSLKKYIGETLLAVWVLGLATAFAATSDDFKAANQLYDTGKFAEAATAYEKIEPKTAHVYYNLGNAWFRQGKMGLAILNYARANRLAPRDPDILANLKFAQQRLGVDDVNTPSSAWQRYLRSVVEHCTLSEWSAYELAGLWLLVVGIACCVYLPKTRTAFLIVGVIGLAGFGFSTFAISYQVINDHSAPPAIVVAGETEARFAPVADSTVHFRLPEGVKIAMREDRGEWILVERADGQQGWVKSDAIGKIANF